MIERTARADSQLPLLPPPVGSTTGGGKSWWEIAEQNPLSNVAQRLQLLDDFLLFLFG